MSRIEPRTTGLFARVTAIAGRRTFGREMQSGAVFANHPRLLLAFARFNGAAEKARHVPKPLCELAVLKAATVVDCPFCIDIGSEYARRSGLSDEQLLALHRAPESGLFDDDQRLVIAVADGMTRTPAVVDDALMERVVARFGTKGALELTHLVAWENTRARLNVALDIAPEGFSDGKVCALPAQAAGAAGDPDDRRALAGASG